MNLEHGSILPLRKGSLRVHRRSGLTLLEIVLSLAIFVAALAALAQLATNGTRATVIARLKTQATIRCEAKLNEVLAGAEQMASRSNTPFPDDSHWTWSQVVTPSSHKELVQLDLTVSHQGNSKMSNVSVTLRRWANRLFLFRRHPGKRRTRKGRGEETMKMNRRHEIRGHSGDGTSLRVIPRALSGGIRSAFTLLETILALSLSALLLGAIYAAIDQSWRTAASGREEMERAQLARALIHKIEIDIRAITFVPPPPVEETDEAGTTTSSTNSGSGLTTGGGGGSGGGGGGNNSGGGGGGGNNSGGGGSGGGNNSGGGGGGGGNNSGGGGKSGGSSGGGSSGSKSGGGSSGSSTSSSFGMAASSAASNSSSTASTTDSTTTEETGPNSKSMGIRGTLQGFEISTARPRRDLLPGTGATATMRTSDLRQVSYSFNPPGTSSVSGLVRTEGDRMAVETLESSGGSATQISTVQMLAPEVAAFHVRYFDGRMWSETWDTDTSGRIPRAIEVSFAFSPPRRKPAIFSAPVSNSMNTFRTVILIPVSDPYPQDFVQ